MQLFSVAQNWTSSLCLFPRFRFGVASSLAFVPNQWHYTTYLLNVEFTVKCSLFDFDAYCNYVTAKSTDGSCCHGRSLSSIWLKLVRRSVCCRFKSTRPSRTLTGWSRKLPILKTAVGTNWYFPALYSCSQNKSNRIADVARISSFWLDEIRQPAACTVIGLFEWVKLWSFGCISFVSYTFWS